MSQGKPHDEDRPLRTLKLGRTLALAVVSLLHAAPHAHAQQQTSRSGGWAPIVSVLGGDTATDDRAADQRQVPVPQPAPARPATSAQPTIISAPLAPLAAPIAAVPASRTKTARKAAPPPPQPAAVATVPPIIEPTLPVEPALPADPEVPMAFEAQGLITGSIAGQASNTEPPVSPLSSNAPAADTRSRALYQNPPRAKPGPSPEIELAQARAVQGAPAQAAPKPEAASPATAPTAAQSRAPGTPERTKLPPPPGDSKPSQQYCFNIADAAADARYAWQKKTITEIEQELDKRVALLEAKTAEYQQWLARREEFSRKAQDGLVKIYARMKPDAAAQQFAAMDEETAAAVVMKLDPRVSSLILNEMPAEQAARLTATIAGAARVDPTPKPKTADASPKPAEEAPR